MAASSGTVYSTAFTELLAGDVYPAGESPKFKSLSPPSLPLSPSTQLLDSPLLLSASNLLPSPTTGTFPAQPFNWNSTANVTREGLKQENNGGFSDFSFLTNPASAGELNWAYQEGNEVEDAASSEKAIGELKTVVNSQSNGGNCSDYKLQKNQALKRSDDGYNWRKYGQKQVKRSENPTSYYKCTHPNCLTKKKVETTVEGEITEIVYKGSHNHPMPQTTRRSAASPPSSYVSNGTGQLDNSVATPENSSVSYGDDDFEQSSRKRELLGGEEFHEYDSNAKRWKAETGNENEGISALGSRTVREPRVVVQTRSDIDILDDGYRWRKYGQKVVRGNPNPRSYYKCTTLGCPVRKHVERAPQDTRSVITTYEGKHNHDVPAARGGHSLNRPIPSNSNNSPAIAIRPSAMSHQSSLLAAILPTQGSGNFGANQGTVFSGSREERLRDDMFLQMLLP